MSKTKKVYYLFGILIFISILTFIIIPKNTLKKETKKEVKYALISNKTKKATFYLNDEYDYYLYSANDLKIKIKDKTYTLEQALKEKHLNYKDILKDLTIVKEYEDGGSILYENAEIRLLECHKTDYNSIYIGDNKMEYEEGFCELPPEMAEFQVLNRTYKVLKINKQDNMFITITLTNNKETVSVKIPKELAKNLKENKLYKFKFHYGIGSIKDNIKSIFSSELVEVVETSTEINDIILDIDY